MLTESCPSTPAGVLKSGRRTQAAELPREQPREGRRLTWSSPFQGNTGSGAELEGEELRAQGEEGTHREQSPRLHTDLLNLGSTLQSSRILSLEEPKGSLSLTPLPTSGHYLALP